MSRPAESALRWLARRRPGPPSPHAARHAVSWRRLSVVLLLGALMVGVFLAVPSLRVVLREIAHMRPLWLVAAVVLEVGSCAGFVVVFRMLFTTVPGKPARRIAWAEMASGALLPGGGVGGLAVGGWLMHLTDLSPRTIVRRSSALYFVTTVANVIAVIVAGVLLATGVASGPGGFARSALPALVAAAATALVLAVPTGRRRGPRHGWLTDFLSGLGDAERALLRPSWRLWGSVGYLVFDMAVLGCTFHALGFSPKLAPLVLAYNLGYLADVIPIPGGVGVLEAGLVGALVLYHFPATSAAAAVLVYHAIAFWVPSLGGLLAFALLRSTLTAHTEQPTPSAVNGRARVSSPGQVD